MKTARITHAVRHMRRYGDSRKIEYFYDDQGRKCHYALMPVDYSDPFGGGAVASERELFADPALIFSWAKNNERIFDENFLEGCGKWMKGYVGCQRIWLRRAKLRNEK